MKSNIVSKRVETLSRRKLGLRGEETLSLVSTIPVCRHIFHVINEVRIDYLLDHCDESAGMGGFPTDLARSILR